MKKVTTFSGAIYIISDSGKVTGGSKDLKNGKLVFGPPVVGKSLLIETPERVALRDIPPPEGDAIPCVVSSRVVEITEI
ncbi:MAG: hypothetical protein IIC67_00230 [Thaumarchaeota archaeon]|nr:hypothetical protein [Nitrososphaerota archaeon]